MIYKFKYLTYFVFLLIACEQETDNTTDIPNTNTGDSTLFRTVGDYTCRPTEKTKTTCKAKCFVDHFGSTECNCTLPTENNSGSCECCSSTSCTTGLYSDTICK